MSNAATEQLAALTSRVDGLATLVGGVSRSQRTLQDSVIGLYKPRADAPPKRMSGAERFRKHAVLRALARPGHTPSDVYREHYTRGAVSPASTVVPGWAAELHALDAADFLLSGTVPSILPQLAALGLSVTLPPAALSIPFPSTAAPKGGWVAEGAPIPSAKLAINSLPVIPHKLACLSSFSNEMLSGARIDVETAVGNVLANDLRRLCDGALVDAESASPSRPAGLRSHAAAIPAGDNMAEDLALLVEAILTAGGSAPAFIVNPLQALAFATLPGQFNFPLLSTPELAPDIVICVDSASFVSAVGAPDLMSTEAALIHEETIPGAISTAGAISAPARSLWQTDCTGIRTIFRATWALAAGRARWIENVAW